MKKCRYCGKELNSNFEFCSNECENSYRKIIEKDRQKIKYFMIGIILGFLVMFYGITSQQNHPLPTLTKSQVVLLLLVDFADCGDGRREDLHRLTLYMTCLLQPHCQTGAQGGAPEG